MTTMSDGLDPIRLPFIHWNDKDGLKKATAIHLILLLASWQASAVGSGMELDTDDVVDILNCVVNTWQSLEEDGDTNA